jgi:hypothetical protein
MQSESCRGTCLGKRLQLGGWHIPRLQLGADREDLAPFIVSAGGTRLRQGYGGRRIFPQLFAANREDLTASVITARRASSM